MNCLQFFLYNHQK